MRSALLLLIMVAQLLIPLLHSHFGTPNQAGLHIHAAPSRVADSHFHLFVAHGSFTDVDEDHVEPFEVDVQDARPRPQPAIAHVPARASAAGAR